MLKQRIVTALILAPLFLAALYLLPPVAFAWVFAAIVLLAGYEWAPLTGWASFWQRGLFCAVLGLLMALLSWADGLRILLLYAAVGLWGVASLRVLRYSGEPRSPQEAMLQRVLGWVFLTAAWAALVMLQRESSGPSLILCAFLLVWCADVGAYFSGRHLGRSRLAPNVSPGKTWEGVFGGLVATMLVLGGAAVYAGLREDALLVALALVLPALVALSIFGDLYESVLKRQTGVKDSGTLLPGHGGLLDRIDSVLAILPAYAIIVLQYVQQN